MPTTHRDHSNAQIYAQRLKKLKENIARDLEEECKQKELKEQEKKDAKD